MTDRRPGEGRYAQIEREQRWLLPAVPAEAAARAEILDRYITGTRLRLRRTQAGDGVVYKLGQKVRADATDPEVVKLTNVYLSAEEYIVLAALPAAELRKTRWRLSWDRRDVAVDELHDRLQGIVLAEVELAPEDSLLPCPRFAMEDVTHDDRFSGGALAFATADDVEALRAEVSGRATTP